MTDVVGIDEDADVRPHVAALGYDAIAQGCVPPP